jgi:F0F1-type ATP synthase assembly protein I
MPENPYLRAAKTPDGKTRLKAQVAIAKQKRKARREKQQQKAGKVISDFVGVATACQLPADFVAALSPN